MALDAGIGANSASDSYEIDNSCKFEADNVEYLTQTPSADSNRQKFTISLWVKRCELGSYQTLYGAQPSGGYSNANTFQFCFTPDDKLGLGLQTFWVFQTNRLFRDTSAWYHIVVRADTTQPFSHNRLRLYVNGVQDTSFSINALASIAQNQLFGVNHTTRQQIGSLIANSWHSSNYISEVHLTDGLSYAPSEFGEFDDSGIWKAKEYTGTYGTNGFYLDFKNSANLGEDQSGNNNDWALNNLSAVDQAHDSPTNNFCTLNRLYKCAGTTMTDGNTNCDRTDNANNTVRGTFVVTKGKWYWEVHVGKGSINANYPFSGMTGNLTLNPCTWVHEDSKTFSMSGQAGIYDVSTYRGSGTAAATSTGTPAYSIFGLAVDIDNQTLKTYTNGVANNSGNTYSIANSVGASTEGMTPMLFMFTGATQSFNFGGYSIYLPSSGQSDANGYGNFEYTPPSGYYSLCTKNLAEYG